MSKTILGPINWDDLAIGDEIYYHTWSLEEIDSSRYIVVGESIESMSQNRRQVHFVNPVGNHIYKFFKEAFTDASGQEYGWKYWKVGGPIKRVKSGFAKFINKIDAEKTHVKT